MAKYIKIFFVLSIILFSLTGHAADLTAIRVIKKENGVRLVFSLSQPAQQTIQLLHHPDRIQITFSQTKLLENVKQLAWDETPIKNIQSLKTLNNLQLTIEANAIAGYRILPDQLSAQYVLDIDAKSSPVKKVSEPQTVSQAEPIETVTIVIDAGHGGKDTGAVGPKGIYEKDVVLAIAKKLADIINRQPHMRAVLTRKGDYFVPLRDRLKLARKGDGDLFVAIHADSYFNKYASGASVYALSRKGATSEAARWIAKRENYSELGGVDLEGLQDQSYVLRSVLIDLAQTATIKDSLHLGTTLLSSLGRVTDLHYKQVEQAPFVVLKSPDIPSVLVETGFISNPKEEFRLNHPEYQTHLAQALFAGMQGYIKKYYAAG